MKSLEKIIAEIKADKDFSNLSDEEIKEMAEMEYKSQEIVNYTATSVGKKSEKPKTVKVSDEKSALFDKIYQNLQSIYGKNAEIIKLNKLIMVNIGEKHFKIDVIEQRPTKK